MTQNAAPTAQRVTIAKGNRTKNVVKQNKQPRIADTPNLAKHELKRG